MKELGKNWGKKVGRRDKEMEKESKGQGVMPMRGRKNEKGSRE